MRKRKLFWRSVAVVVLLFLCVIVVPLVGVVVECKPFAAGPPAEAASSAITAGQTRPEDQTYLTLPEWYIVYSADEYAAFIAHNPPSRFPHFRAIAQYWRTYYDVCNITRDRYPFNSGYHLTLVVIGTSFTLENIVKGLYEGTLGRLTEWLSSDDLTEEDAYARQVAQAYGDFIHTVPWYEFPFNRKLNGLWNETDSWGTNALRKWERKAALSAEYGAKSLYGGLIKQGTQSAYAPEDLEIVVQVEDLTDEMLVQHPQIEIIEKIDDQPALITLPRYEAFTQLVPQLAAQGLRFVEITGNNEILITAIAPADWDYSLPEGEFLFAMPILTQPDLKRVAIKAPVKSLHTILTGLENSEANIEHIYDY